MENNLPSENKENSQAGNDDLIQQALAPLRSLKIPKSVRTSSWKRIKDALSAETPDRSKAKAPWWYRRITIPFPVAAGFLIAFALLGILNLSQISRWHGISQSKDIARFKPTITKQKEPYYSEKTFYVKGVGFINKERVYQFFQENNHEINL